MPECKLLDHGICIGPGGNVRPCCAWRDSRDEPSVNYSEDWATRHSEWNTAMKQEWLPQCFECKQSEDLGRGSLRTLSNQRLQNAQGIEYWDLKINNTCNLACRMCDPWSSSKWGELMGTPGLITGPAPDTKWHSSALEFVPEMMFAKYIKFTGGEPFLIPQVRAILLKLVELDVSSTVNLELVTNGTQDMTSWCEVFAQFKTVRISVSVDALGKRYEYIRPHGVWPETERRIFELQAHAPTNTSIGIACLEMILNTGQGMQEVEQWCKRHGLDFWPGGPIIFPTWLRVDALEHSREQFQEQMGILDGVYGTNWRDWVDA